MSDVWRELEERLKQKAKSYLQITLEIAKEVDVAKAEKGKESKVKEPKWVRLEDVESAIQQLKQKYVLVSKEWLNKMLEEERIRTKFIDDLILEILQKGRKGVVAEK